MVTRLEASDLLEDIDLSQRAKDGGCHLATIVNVANRRPPSVMVSAYPPLAGADEPMGGIENHRDVLGGKSVSFEVTAKPISPPENGELLAPWRVYDRLHVVRELPRDFLRGRSRLGRVVAVLILYPANTCSCATKLL
jgi:hypothetical protein